MNISFLFFFFFFFGVFFSPSMENRIRSLVNGGREGGKGPVFYMTIDVNRLLLQWRVGVQYSGTMYKTWGWKILVSSEGEIWWRNERTWVFRSVNFISHFLFSLSLPSSAFILKRNIRIIQGYLLFRKLKGFLITCSWLSRLVVCRKIWFF